MAKFHVKMHTRVISIVLTILLSMKRLPHKLVIIGKATKLLFFLFCDWNLKQPEHHLVKCFEFSHSDWGQNPEYFHHFSVSLQYK